MAKQDKENTSEFTNTLNLPQTDFSMRGNLPQKEPAMLQHWNDIDIYGKIREKSKGKPKFILHDGPPYANGDIHLGHALNKVLKDIIIKYKTMTGYDAPYVPGWDTHGLPIEQKAIKDLESQINTQNTLIANNRQEISGIRTTVADQAAAAAAAESLYRLVQGQPAQPAGQHGHRRAGRHPSPAD